MRNIFLLHQESQGVVCFDSRVKSSLNNIFESKSIMPWDFDTSIWWTEEEVYERPAKTRWNRDC